MFNMCYVKHGRGERKTERDRETYRDNETVSYQRELILSSDTEKSYNSNLAFLISPGVSQAMLPCGVLPTS